MYKNRGFGDNKSKIEITMGLELKDYKYLVFKKPTHK